MASGLAGVVTVCVLLPYFTVSLPFLIFAFRRHHSRYVLLGREIKRLDGTTRAPLLSHLGVTAAGLACVRAFGRQRAFEAEFFSLNDANNRAHIAFVHAGRWLGVRLDALAALGVAVAAACVTAAASKSGAGGLPPLAPGLAGMALVASLTFTGTLQYAIRQARDTFPFFYFFFSLHFSLFSQPSSCLSWRTRSHRWSGLLSTPICRRRRRPGQSRACFPRAGQQPAPL